MDPYLDRGDRIDPLANFHSYRVLQESTVTPRDMSAWETCNEDRLFWILDRHIKKDECKEQVEPLYLCRNDERSQS